MSRDTTVIPFRQPDAIDDPLTEVAREGARRMLAQVLIAEADAFVALWKTAATASCVMAMDRSAPSRPGLGLSRSGAPKCATGVMLARKRKSASRRRFCRSGRVGPRASTRCCQFSTCAGCQPAISRRGSPPSWARTRQTCRRP